MTPTEAAAELNGNQYRDEGSKVLWESMKLFGLVAVFGASDDLMEFRGAINDEIGAYNGGTAYITKDGLLTNECDSDERCPYFHKMKSQAATIEAKWDDGGFSFRYETDIPLFDRRMDELHQQYKFTAVVHGGASGADTMAQFWAGFNGLPIEVYHANWKKHGKAAGPIRNQRMIDEARPDVVVAFAGGRGTADIKRRALASGIGVFTFDESITGDNYEAAAVTNGERK